MSSTFDPFDYDAEMPARKGRGARTNPANRFEPLRVEEDPAALEEDELQQIETQYLKDTTRSILAKNDSPDIPFTYSINPYRGCEHGCVYCLAGETPILMEDGTTQPLSALQPGDRIYGTRRRGFYRRYVRTEVLDQWETYSDAFRIELADGTTLVAGADHRFLTDRGWKFVTGAEQGKTRRPHLTLNNKLMGVGQFATPPDKGPVYRRGYLTGLILGDGHVGFYPYQQEGRAHGHQYQFRLVLKDTSALVRAHDYLEAFGIATHRFVFATESPKRSALEAIRTHARDDVREVNALISWPDSPRAAWMAGYLAGFFDAEGSYSECTLRMSNTDAEIIEWAKQSLDFFGFKYRVERRRNGTSALSCIRLLGGLQEHLRFFHTTGSAIARKCDIEGQAVKSTAKLQVQSIEYVGKQRLYDITTGTGDFVADGVISHNCYARPTHEYLGFSAGLDFETKIVVKEKAPELLSEALQKPSWTPQVVTLSGNTDPYQPVERKLQLTRRCLEVLLRHRNPVGIITKNGLITRDLDVLQALAERNLVAATISVTSLRPEVIGAMEPRTARPALRLKAIEQLAEAGIPVGVNAAPLIPGLTDEELPSILEAAAERGASYASYIVVRLPGAVEELFVDWLERHFPARRDKVLRRIRSMRGGKLNETRFGHRMRAEGEWGHVLHRLYEMACRKHGLNKQPLQLSTEQFRRLPGGQLGLF